MSGGGFLRRVLAQNLELKFLALVIGLAIFYSREREETAERTLQVDVMTIGEQSLGDLVRVSPLPGKIEIAVRGPERQVAGLRADQIGPLALPIRAAVEEGRLELRRDMFNLPDGVRMLWADPAAIDFRFERRASKVVPVALELGDTDRDVVVDLERSAADPDEVLVTGAESIVGPIHELRTLRIELAGRRPGTMLQDVGLSVPRVESLTAAVESVRVAVVLVADLVDSERTGLPVEVVRGTDFDPGGTLVYGAEGLRAAVRVRGVRSVIEMLDASALRLFVQVDLNAFVDRDGDGVLEAEIPIQAVRAGESWSVVEITPAVVPMTWIPPPPPPAEEPLVETEGQPAAPAPAQATTSARAPAAPPP
ncbi:MAG: hypothetical protein JXB32_07315 [Deltaproteobacteria bacterium]|nr:hypothetical protein [Deltaproteobacteria bacterium]